MDENRIEVISPQDCKLVDVTEIHDKNLKKFIKDCNDQLSRPWHPDQKWREILAGSHEDEVIDLGANLLKKKGWYIKEKYIGYGIISGLRVRNPFFPPQKTLLQRMKEICSRSSK